MTESSRPSPLAPVSWGEFIDKITILEIKRAHLRDAAALANVNRELAALEAIFNQLTSVPPTLTALVDDLRTINATLWTIEDDIRDHERQQNFDAGFIALARAVYHTNDRRAAVKREINRVLSSELVEEKSYQPYEASP